MVRIEGNEYATLERPKYVATLGAPVGMTSMVRPRHWWTRASPTLTALTGPGADFHIVYGTTKESAKGQREEKKRPSDAVLLAQGWKRRALTRRRASAPLSKRSRWRQKFAVELGQIPPGSHSFPLRAKRKER
eukprot:scaffold1661_cov251-Pinguiococcus_pyrenoidosus.AAC.45